MFLVVAEMKSMAQCSVQPPSHVHSFLSAPSLNPSTEMTHKQYRQFMMPGFSPLPPEVDLIQLRDLALIKASYSGSLCPKPSENLDPMFSLVTLDCLPEFVEKDLCF